MFADEDEKVTRKKSKKVAKGKKDVSKSKESLQTKYFNVNLPSGGRLDYPASVEYREILVRDEKILSSSTGDTWAVTLDKVLRSLLKDSESYYDQLTLHDRDFLLMWIWANNYSTVKSFDVLCPHCNHKNDNFTVDLTELDIKELDEDFKNPFKIKLSNDEEVSVRLITIHDDDVVMKFIDKHPEHDYASVLMINSMIFERVLPLQQKIKYVEDNVTGRDMSLVRSIHAHFKYGVDNVVEYTCSACRGVAPFSIPFQESFFLPVVSSDLEDFIRSNKES